MGYPGDQGKFDGRPSEPPVPGADPHGPEQAGADRPGQDGSPFDPPPGAFAARPGDSFGFGPGAGRPGPGFGTDGPDTGGFGAGNRFGQGPTERREPGPAGGPGGRAGQESPESPSFGSAGQELYGAMGERYFSADAGPGEPLGHARSHADEPRSTRRLPLVIGGAVVAGLVLIGGGFAVSSLLSDDSDKGAAASAPQPQASQQTASPTPSVSTGPLNVKLKSRATDPSPLTLKEVFRRESFTIKGKKYVRTAWKHDRDCTKVVNGTKLAATLKKGGCAQVLRATYARSDGLLVGTVGVLNLKTENWAKAAEKAGSGRDAYLQPLPGTGYSKKIGKGAALGTSFVRGHYLIMTWVQRPDGKTIASKYHEVVSNFQQQIILGSNLSKALHYRGIEGKPLTG